MRLKVNTEFCSYYISLALVAGNLHLHEHALHLPYPTYAHLCQIKRYSAKEKPQRLHTRDVGLARTCHLVRRPSDLRIKRQ